MSLRRFFSSGDLVQLDLSENDTQAFLGVLDHAEDNGVGGGCSDYELENTDENWDLVERMGAWNLNIPVEEWRQHEEYSPRPDPSRKIYTRDFMLYGYFEAQVKSSLHRFWEDRNERKASAAKYRQEEKRLKSLNLVKPRFSNGSEFEHWCSKNCNRCTKSLINLENQDAYQCELEEKGLGGWLNGDPIPAELAERLGYEEGEIFMGDCTEREPTPMPLVLITGTRRAKGEHAEKQVSNALALVVRRLFPGHGPWELVHGDCEGVDRIARDLYESEEGKRRGYITKPFPADWEGQGRSAGPLRNPRMVAYALERESAQGDPPVIVVAMPDLKSKGTWDCVRQAASAGLPILLMPFLDEEDKPV